MSAKKVTIEKKDLPPLTPNGEYLIRYRVISEDKNRTSHWSPIYTLDAILSIEDVESRIVVTPGDIIITWGDLNKAALYDIFVSYKVGGTWGSYEYHGSSQTHAYAFLQPLSPTEVGYGGTDVRVAIQIAGIEQTRNVLLTISMAEQSLRPTIGGGTA
jgi:hypothetical protein